MRVCSLSIPLTCLFLVFSTVASDDDPEDRSHLVENILTVDAEIKDEPIGKILEAGEIVEDDALVEDADKQTEKRSKKEMETKLKLILAEMDTDEDSLINYDELLFWIFRAIHAIDGTNNARAQYREADGNKDGMLAFDELLTYELIESEDQAHYVYFSNRRYHRMVGRWVAANVNSDKAELTLSYSGFMKFKNPFRNREAVIKMQETALEAIDKDKDGAIDNNEYLYNDWGVPPPQLNSTLGRIGAPEHKNDALAQVLREEIRLFDVLDLDGDTFLRGKEIVLWLSPDNVLPAMEETERLFKACGDISKDIQTATLKFSQILKAADVFVKSKAMRMTDELR